MQRILNQESNNARGIKVVSVHLVRKENLLEKDSKQILTKNKEFQSCNKRM